MAAPPPREAGPDERAWAAHLLARADEGDEVAFLRFEGTVAFVARPPPARGEPASAVVDLVQGAWEAFPGMAHAALRQRVFFTGAASELDRAIVKVAASKLTALVEPEAGPVANLDELDLAPWARSARERAREGASAPPASIVDEAGRWEALEGWARAPVDEGAPLAERDRAVAAALVVDGRVLGAARNTAGANRTLHAELNLAQAWWEEHRTPLPSSSTVWTTLQPCRMCAAALVAAGPPREVRYRTADPGRYATGTALQRLGLERQT